MVGMTTTSQDDTYAAVRGDRSAFERLLSPHHAAALALAARLLGSPDDAEDAVQDALVKTWTTRDALAGVRDVRAWFLRVVFHRCLDVRRRLETRRGHEQAVPAGSAPSPEEGSARRETLRRVREVMTELPPKQQAVLHLRVFEELDYAAIGAVLDLTPHSARVYLVKARAHLRARLSRELEDR